MRASVCVRDILCMHRKLISNFNANTNSNNKMPQAENVLRLRRKRVRYQMEIGCV